VFLTQYPFRQKPRERITDMSASPDTKDLASIGNLTARIKCPSLWVNGHSCRDAGTSSASPSPSPAFYIQEVVSPEVHPMVTCFTNASAPSAVSGTVCRGQGCQRGGRPILLTSLGRATPSPARQHPAELLPQQLVTGFSALGILSKWRVFIGFARLPCGLSGYK